MKEKEYTIPEDYLKNAIMANLPKSVKVKSINVKFKIKSKSNNKTSNLAEKTEESEKELN